MSLLKTGDGQAHGPDLLSKAGTAGAHGDGKGILSQLEHGVAAPAARPALRWRPGWRHWAAGALCLAVLITAVLAYDTSIMPLPLPSPCAPAAPALLSRSGPCAWPSPDFNRDKISPPQWIKLD